MSSSIELPRPPLRPIKRLLVANRGEIAVRILSTARELDIETFSLYTTDDTSHILNSSHAIQLSSPSSYLNISELLEIVRKHNIDAIHPGYGFLSESAEFVHRMWVEANAVVIGPGWDVLARTGDKLHARLLAEECDVPVLPALQTPTDELADLEGFAKRVGYPLIIKAVDGGGGRGIRIVHEERDLANLMERALRESPCQKVFAEKAAVNGFRHVEVQIMGDGVGNVRHLWERECSIQRRFQKVVEFAPSSIRDRGLVAEVIVSALRMARKVNYMSLGTFEFLVRESPPEFYFLEVNPRLQVEHTITESICMGLDLVKLQLQIAAGQDISSLLSHFPEDPRIPPPLHSLQLRITAEDASNDWSLSIGKISSSILPAGNGIRIDTNLVPTMVVKTDFDSLLAKVIITSQSWTDVVAKAKRALADTNIEGVTTTLDALRGIISHPDFTTQSCDTQWLETSLPSILTTGKSLTANLAKRSLPSSAQQNTAISASSSSMLFRKGDAWSITLTPESQASPSASSEIQSHLQIARILRNDFPSSLSASVIYTTPSGATPYTLSLSATNASAAALASSSKHRRGDKANPNHIIIPFPGQLVEIVVDEGDVIAKGEVVAVVRQMKMELEIRAARAGRVVWAFEGEEGEEVAEGCLVAEVVDENSGSSKL